MALLSREIELYDFSIGLHHWRYTDAKREAIVEGQRYAPTTLTREKIVQSAEDAKNALQITAPLDLPLLNLFRPVPPGLRLRLDLKRVRVRDGQVRLGWTGHVANLDETHSVAKLRCESLAAAGLPAFRADAGAVSTGHRRAPRAFALADGTGAQPAGQRCAGA